MHDWLILFPMAPGQGQILAAQGWVILRQKNHHGVIGNFVCHLRMLDKILVELGVQNNIFISQAFLVHFPTL
jgi:hypothetical protein